MIKEVLKLKNKIIHNRVVIQPMEGCDCEENGAPSELTIRKYLKFAESGAGIIWFEANAVCEEGRTNTRQMRITRENLSIFHNLLQKVKEISIKKYGFAPLLLIQLTHSGRQSIRPMIAYHHPIYEATRPVTDENIVTDEYLDSLPEKFVEAAQLSYEAGFDGVDVKSCHGYLMQELLSAFNRKGRYGGSFENRIRAFVDCFEAVRKAMPKDFIVASRIGLCDMLPKPYGFGTTEDNTPDLTESKQLLRILQDKGLTLLNITLGNPYYNPHVNRPFRVGAYVPPEKPEVGLARFKEIEIEIKKEFPNLITVASGLSYYRENLMEKAEELLAEGACDLVGFGRGALAYPQFYVDYQNGEFNAKKSCVACSKCTTLMRSHCVSGCATFDDYYKQLYKEKCVCKK